MGLDRRETGGLAGSKSHSTSLVMVVNGASWPGNRVGSKPMQDMKAQLPCAFVTLARPQTRVFFNFLNTTKLLRCKDSTPSNRGSSDKPLCRGPLTDMPTSTLASPRWASANQTNLLLAPPQPPFGKLSKRPQMLLSTARAVPGTQLAQMWMGKSPGDLLQD